MSTTTLLNILANLLSILAYICSAGVIIILFNIVYNIAGTKGIVGLILSLLAVIFTKIANNIKNSIKKRKEKSETK